MPVTTELKLKIRGTNENGHVGPPVGRLVGCGEGPDGRLVGIEVGTLLGEAFGSVLGCPLGFILGCPLG